MNPAFLRAMSEVKAPFAFNSDKFPGRSSTAATTSAINRFGDVVVIDQSGTLKYANIRGVENVGLDVGEGISFMEMKVEGLTPEAARLFTNIEFDADGSVLLLWQPLCVGVVRIPREFFQAGYLQVDYMADESCFFRILCQSTPATATATATAASSTMTTSRAFSSDLTSPVAKASFHPLNPSFVVVLCSSGERVLRLLDLRAALLPKNFNEAGTVMEKSNGITAAADATAPILDESMYFSFTKSLKFTSFAFGSDLEWLKFSLFLLTVKGEIFVLCPIIPDGTIITQSLVNELWLQLKLLMDDSDCDSDSGASMAANSIHQSRSGYIQGLQNYLLSTFGPPRPLTPSYSSASSSSSSSTASFPADFYIRVGELSSRTASFREGLEGGGGRGGAAAFVSGGTYRPMLQGPLIVDKGCSFTRQTVDNSNTGNKNKFGPPTGLNSSGFGGTAAARTAATTTTTTTTARANDICVPLTHRSTIGQAMLGGVSLAAGDGTGAGVGAPVVVVSYDSGSIDYFLLDPATPNAPIICPAWRSIDRSVPDLVFSTFAFSAPLSSTSVERGRAAAAGAAAAREVIPATPALILAESIPLDIPLSIRAAGTGKSSFWALTPDPVFSHYMYATNHAAAQSYLISSSWLHRALSSLPSSDHNNNSSSYMDFDDDKYDEEEEEREGFYDRRARRGDIGENLSPLAAAGAHREEKQGRSSRMKIQHKSAENSRKEVDLEPSFCVPLYVAAEASGSAATPAQALSSVNIISDPFVGHVALFRKADKKQEQLQQQQENEREKQRDLDGKGEVNVVNITVHTKMFEFQTNIAQRKEALASRISGRVGDAPTTAVAGGAGGSGADNNGSLLLEKMSHDLIMRIANNLRDVPTLEHSLLSESQGEDGPAEADVPGMRGLASNQLLAKAAIKLERDVLIPLTELAQTNKLRRQLLLETAQEQMEVLFGADAAKNTIDNNNNNGDNENTGADDKAADLSAVWAQSGLQGVVRALQKQQQALRGRVAKIQGTFEEQRDMAERSLLLAITQKSQMSRAEHLYKRQLEEWTRVVAEMSRSVEHLQRVAIKGAVVAPSHCASSSLSSPAAAQTAGLFSPSFSSFSTTTAAGARAKAGAAGAQRRVGPPLRSSSMFAAAAAGGTSDVGDSYHGAASAGFDSPSPALVRYSAGGTTHSPFSASGLTSSPHLRTLPPPPLPLSAAAAYQASPTSAIAQSVSRQHSQQQHTRSAMLSRSQASKYSSVRSQQQQLVLQQQRRLAEQQNKQQTQRGGGRSAVDQQQSQEQEEERIVLTPEDEQSCLELLTAQTRMIEASQDRLRDLEKKVARLQAQMN